MPQRILSDTFVRMHDRNQWQTCVTPKGFEFEERAEDGVCVNYIFSGMMVSDKLLITNYGNTYKSYKHTHNHSKER